MINFQVACRRIRQVFVASARRQSSAPTAGQPFQATPRLGVVLEHSIVFTLHDAENAFSFQEGHEVDACSDAAEDCADPNNPATRVYSHTGKRSRKHKEVPAIPSESSYKVVGRLSPQDCLHPELLSEHLAERLAHGTVSELYVCLPADAPDSMAEMAFRMASVM